MLLCWAIHLYIRLVYRTNRWTVEGGECAAPAAAEGKGFILAFWHGRLLMIPMAWQRLAPMHMLISAHRDGRIIADAVAYFGIHSIAGSTRRGGTAALRAMLKHLKEGDCVGITPDGPRGPAMRASIGIVNAARSRRRADRADHLRDAADGISRDLGPLSSRPAVRPWALSLGRADCGGCGSGRIRAWSARGCRSKCG